MALTLDQLLRLFVVDRPAFDRRPPAPVLLWEGPQLEKETDARDSWAPTSSGVNLDRPRTGETLVLTVEKVPSRANPFAMGVTIGRVGTNDIVINDSSISRFHAFLQHDPGRDVWSLSDADSQNGTSVDGVRVLPGHRKVLADGQRVQLGDVTVRFFCPQALVTYLQGIVEPA